MKSNLTILFVAVVCVVGLSTVSDATAGTAPPIPLGAGEVSVHQIYFTDSSGRYVSDTFSLTVDGNAVESATGLRTSYLSARNSQGWLVTNLVVHGHPEDAWPDRVARSGIRPRPKAVPLSVDIQGPSNAPTSTLDLIVFVTSQPLTRSGLGQMTLPRPIRLSVSPYEVDFNYGSDIDSGGVPPLPPPPPLDMSLDGPDLGPVGGGGMGPPPMDIWLQPADQNVNAANDQCVSMAFANVLNYLEEVFVVGAFQFHIKGTAGGVSLVGRLDELMDRPFTDTCIGDGAPLCHPQGGWGTVLGLTEYLWTYTPSVTLSAQGMDIDNHDILACSEAAPYTTNASMDVGPPKFDWICDRVQDGDGVVVVRKSFWTNGPGFHALRVYGCGTFDGKPFLRVSHDRQQDKMMGDPKQCTIREGLHWQQWNIDDVDNDGFMNVNGDATKELVWAASLHAP